MSLVSMKLYYQFCPAITVKLAHFPATVAGGEVASLVPVQGKCVPNAEKVGNETELSKFFLSLLKHLFCFTVNTESQWGSIEVTVLTFHF